MADGAVRQTLRRSAIWVMLGIVAVGAGWWAFSSRPWEPRAVIVPVETVSPGAVSRVLAINGRLVPRHQVELSSTVGGRVAVHLARKGAPGSSWPTASRRAHARRRWAAIPC